MINSIREHCILQEGDFWEVVSEMNESCSLKWNYFDLPKNMENFMCKVKLNSFSFRLYFEWHPPSAQKILLLHN